MAQSRVKNTVRNSSVGIISYICTSVMTFVARTIFIKVLGVEYLGISGLYSNILVMLSLSDLGINTAMVYALYKPISENDTVKISNLLHYFKKLYYIIAGVVTILGIACIPLLPYIIKDCTLAQTELTKYYLLILANSVCSYFAISKSTLIRADQHMSTVQLISAICTIGMHGVQIIILLALKNYFVYLVVPIVFTMINNIVLSIIVDRKYPYLKDKHKVNVGKEIKEYITNNLKATFVYKLGASIINSTDNILISVLLGTVMVGYYNNYFLVVSFVNAVIAILIQSIIASVGNYNATQDAVHKYRLFNKLILGFYGLAAFCAACYLSVFSDFVSIWIGSEFILGDLFLISLVFSNFIACISNPIWMTRESSGLFKEVRYVMLSAAILNIIFSVVLGKTIGLAGIIFATGISRLLTMFWYEPKMLCTKVFNVRLSDYWFRVIRVFIACVPSFVTGWLLRGIPTGNLLFMFGKVIICGVVTLMTFLLFFYKTGEVFILKSMLLGKFKKTK